MPFKPSRLEARVALNGDHKLVARQRGAVTTTDDDPFGWLTSLFGGGEEETTTTRRTSTTTTRLATLTTPTPVNTNTRTSTTPTSRSTSSSTSTALLATTPPPVATPSRQTTTITSTSAGLDSSQANANSGNSSSSGGLPSVVIGIIVAASVIFGLIFLALIARKVFQARRRNRRNTWARNSTIAPFDAPITTTEKALPPPPPPKENSYPVSYPAYPPAAVAPSTAYNNIPPGPYSPAAPSSAGYPAPYPFGGPNPALLTPSSYLGAASAAAAGGFTAADLAGPVVIQNTPPTPTAPAPGVAAPVSIVKRTFIPSLPDELSIANGDQVRIVSAYDDGWALCEKVSTGERGVVPQECLEAAKPNGGDDARLNRNSSLRRQAD